MSASSRHTCNLLLYHISPARSSVCTHMNISSNLGFSDVHCHIWWPAYFFSVQMLTELYTRLILDCIDSWRRLSGGTAVRPHWSPENRLVATIDDFQVSRTEHLNNRLLKDNSLSKPVWHSLALLRWSCYYMHRAVQCCLWHLLYFLCFDLSPLICRLFEHRLWL